LRARIGQEFEVVCGDIVRRGSVATVSEERVEFVLGEEVRTTASVPITLMLAVFKFDRMEWAIEKCTELNVTSIVPVIVRRTDKHLVQAAEKRAERWRRIAREASEQARRVAVPEIGEPKKLSGALDVPADLRIVLADTKREAQLNEILHVRPEAESLALAIGPEGGWAQDELQSFKHAGWIAASLGPTILRAETAAIAAMAVARGELG